MFLFLFSMDKIKRLGVFQLKGVFKFKKNE